MYDPIEPVSPDASTPPACYLDPAKVGYRITSDVVYRDQYIDCLLEAKSNGSQPVPGLVSRLKVTVRYLTKKIVHISVEDERQPRYRVPIPLGIDIGSGNQSINQTNYEVSVPDSGDFYLTVTRKETGLKL